MHTASKKIWAFLPTSIFWSNGFMPVNQVFCRHSLKWSLCKLRFHQLYHLFPCIQKGVRCLSPWFQGFLSEPVRHDRERIGILKCYPLYRGNLFLRLFPVTNVLSLLFQYFLDSFNIQVQSFTLTVWKSLEVESYFCYTAFNFEVWSNTPVLSAMV